MVATSSNRALVAGRTAMLTVPRYARAKHERGCDHRRVDDVTTSTSGQCPAAR
jgi:hypothetical protein